MEQDVEVIGVSRSTDFITGKTIYSIQFGTLSDVEPRPLSNNPPAISVSAAIFADFDGSAPYKVGSKWKMIVDDENGFVELRPCDVL